MVCENCGSSNIEFDQSQGNSICVNCGSVLEENTIVSEVTFGETSTGASVLQGQFVSADKGKTSAPVFGYNRHMENQSREITIANAKRRLQALAGAVRLSDHHVEIAHRWFILAIQHNFTRGRKSQNVVAACLYIVCRSEKTPHMLLDFSDILKTNVYELGNTFLRLVRLLNLDLPLIDPSLYISRFASRLEFGEKTQSIAKTSLRLVARMKRDWMVTGRRPAGICGACLYIAARMHQENRDIKRIIQVVRVCENTIKTRLYEFSETPSSKLTTEEFNQVWLEEEADPPSFTRSQMKRELEKESTEIEQQVKESLKELSTLEIEQLDNESLSDFEDDDEINSVIMAKNEIEQKTELWTMLNAEYLEAQKIKKDAPVPVKMPRKKKKHVDSVAETPLEATLQLVEKKKLSKRINYQALDVLFGA